MDLGIFGVCYVHNMLKFIFFLPGVFSRGLGGTLVDRVTTFFNSISWIWLVRRTMDSSLTFKKKYVRENVKILQFYQ